MAVITQSIANSSSVVQNAGNPLSISAAFGSNNAAGSFLLVLLGYDTENISIIGSAAVTDSRGNTYTHLFDYGKGVNTGPGLAAFYCSSATAGANTVTGHFATDWIGFGTHSTTWNQFIIALEFPPGYALQSFGSVQNDATNTTSAALTNHAGTSITINISSVANYNAWAVIDMYGASKDHLYAVGIGNLTSGGSPGGDTFTSSPAGWSGPASLLTDAVITAPSVVEYLELYQLGPGDSATPQIYVIN
jgi:hypothetical protein